MQSNLGRTGDLFAFETYGIEPDIVAVGKSLGNGVPVAAAVGRRDLLASLDYGEGSDTWSRQSPVLRCRPGHAGRVARSEWRVAS